MSSTTQRDSEPRARGFIIQQLVRHVPGYGKGGAVQVTLAQAEVIYNQLAELTSLFGRSR